MTFDVQRFEDVLATYAKERSAPEWEPVRLGFGDLDADMRGISPGQVALIAARTGVGKTWILGSVLHNFTIRDEGCLVLTLEMPSVEWAERQVGMFLDVAPEQVEAWTRRGELGQHVGDFLERMRHVRLIEDHVKLEQLPAAIQAARANLGDVPLRLVLIDYLGMLGATGRDAYERASAIGKGLKTVAKSERVPIIVATQLSREGRDGSEPVTLPMLRDSGVIEESADFVIGAWRPGKAATLSPPEEFSLRHTLRCVLLKNRKGDDGRVVDLTIREQSRRIYQPERV